MTALHRVADVTLIILTGTFLVVGTLLAWASQSYYAFIWVQARACFPDQGVRILMVNTEATLPLREKYALPHDIKHNIALRALVINKEDRVVATAWREGHLSSYPEVPLAKEPLGLNIAFLQAFTWMQVARSGGWVMLGIGLVQALCLLFGSFRVRMQVHAS